MDHLLFHICRHDLPAGRFGPDVPAQKYRAVYHIDRAGLGPARLVPAPRDFGL